MPTGHPVFRDLRAHILSMPPSEIGISPTERHPRVWAALMEMGFSEGSASLVALADGTTSLYTSTGGGTIGAGEHEVVAAETKRFLEVVDGLLDQLAPTSDFRVPGPGRVAFHVRTFDAGLTAEADEDELGAGRHGLSLAFFAGHEVISRLRETEEALGGAR